MINAKAIIPRRDEEIEDGPVEPPIYVCGITVCQNVRRHVLGVECIIQ